MLPKVYDRHGVLQSRAWVYQNYGFVDALPPIKKPREGGSRFALVALKETRGNVLTATVLAAPDAPLAAQKVVLYWPDAPGLPRAGWLEQGAIAVTDRHGHAIHILGDGAAYQPPIIGPHALWIDGTNVSHMITGLGIVDGFHLAPTFLMLSNGEALEPDPVAQALVLLQGASKHMGSAIDDVAAAMERLQCVPEVPEHVPH